MRILITGAGGFVGSALIERLAQESDVEQIVALDISTMTAPGVDPLCGDLRDPAVRDSALAHAPDVIFHLAAVPGGAAAADPALSRAINLDATLDLFDAAALARPGARVVYAGTIAALGDPLPALVDDDTPRRPAMTYGAHKLMVEVALADMTRRGALDGVCVRLPGIVARPQGASGLKSAFMSDVFHALRAGTAFTSPVSTHATMWIMSVRRCVDNLVHAMRVEGAAMPASCTVTLPAVRASMAELVGTIAQRCGVSADLVHYAPNPALEHAFGAYPPLRTPAAERAGFASDGDVASLVDAVFAGMGEKA